MTVVPMQLGAYVYGDEVEVLQNGAWQTGDVLTAHATLVTVRVTRVIPSAFTSARLSSHGIVAVRNADEIRPRAHACGRPRTTMPAAARDRPRAVGNS